MLLTSHLFSRKRPPVDTEAERDRRLGLVEVESNEAYFRRLDTLEASRRPKPPTPTIVMGGWGALAAKATEDKAAKNMNAKAAKEEALRSAKTASKWKVSQVMPEEQPEVFEEPVRGEEVIPETEPELAVTAKAELTPIAVGDAVQAWHHEWNDWFPAVIMAIRDNLDVLEYDVQYDDTEDNDAFEYSKPPEEIHAPGSEDDRGELVKHSTSVPEDSVFSKEPESQDSENSEDEGVAMYPSLAEDTTVTTNSMATGVEYKTDERPETAEEKKKRYKEAKEEAAKDSKARKTAAEAQKKLEKQRQKEEKERIKESKRKEKEHKARKAKEKKETKKKEKVEANKVICLSHNLSLSHVRTLCPSHGH